MKIIDTVKVYNPICGDPGCNEQPIFQEMLINIIQEDDGSTRKENSRRSGRLFRYATEEECENPPPENQRVLLYGPNNFSSPKLLILISERL